MCLLTYYPPNEQPDTDALYNGATTNDDGHGWGIVTDGQLLVGKSLKADEAIETFAKVRALHPEGAALFHSRYTTDGLSTLDNCHPFYVGGDQRTLIAHNGIMPANVRPEKGDPRSDTRITAEDFLPRFGNLYSAAARKAFARWMTPNNKVVILTVDPRFRQQSYILNEDSGMWEGETWYSNSAYLPDRWADSRRIFLGTANHAGNRAYGYSWEHGDEADDESDDAGLNPATGKLERCPDCRTTFLDSNEDEVCMVCGFCLDCWGSEAECECFAADEWSAQPSKLTRALALVGGKRWYNDK